jgi:hypothetical protein
MSARSATPRYLFLAQADLFVNILIIAAGAGANQSPNPLPKGNPPCAESATALITQSNYAV